MQKTKQWHETYVIEKQDILLFLKKYQPNSYEIRNEVSWLLSNMIQNCRSFDLPKVYEANISNGVVLLEHINDFNLKQGVIVVDYLVECAVELHSLVRSRRAYLRQGVFQPSDYTTFLRKYYSYRINVIDYEEVIDREIVVWMMNQLNHYLCDYFTLVHRDMRARHLLFPSNGKKPYLIDWEFSNISEPVMDLAKIIYDAVVQQNLCFENMLHRVVSIYAQATGIDAEILLRKVLVFIPLIPLEHMCSFVERKPINYKNEIAKDLLFIHTAYEKNN